MWTYFIPSLIMLCYFYFYNKRRDIPLCDKVSLDIAILLAIIWPISSAMLTIEHISKYKWIKSISDWYLNKRP